MSGISSSGSIKIERSMKKYPRGLILRFFRQIGSPNSSPEPPRSKKITHFFSCPGGGCHNSPPGPSEPPRGFRVAPSFNDEVAKSAMGRAAERALTPSTGTPLRASYPRVPYRRGNLRSKYHKNQIVDKIWFLTWFGLVLRSDSESA